MKVGVFANSNGFGVEFTYYRVFFFFASVLVLRMKVLIEFVNDATKKEKKIPKT